MRARSEGPHAEQGDRAEASHERGRHSVRTPTDTVKGGRCNEPFMTAEGNDACPRIALAFSNSPKKISRRRSTIIRSRSSISGRRGARHVVHLRRPSPRPRPASRRALRQGKHRGPAGDRRAFQHPLDSDADDLPRQHHRLRGGRRTAGQRARSGARRQRARSTWTRSSAKSMPRRRRALATPRVSSSRRDRPQARQRR